jgi:hypothetical protein
MPRGQAGFDHFLVNLAGALEAEDMVDRLEYLSGW